jgi:hypothetical protein
MTGKILVVLASRRDAAAAKLVAAKSRFGVRMMTPEDLSQRGWNFRVHDPAASVGMLGGSPVPATAIAGVVTRLGGVTEHDLPHIAQPDRTYVAAEMNAFLFAWLTSLECPVVNRPTPQCLSGVYWGQEKWVLTAKRLGIPARPVVRRDNEAIDAVDAKTRHTVTVVGRKQIGAVDPALAERAHALAETVAVDVLAVEFDGQGRDASFVNASLWPDLGDTSIADAVIALVRDKRRRRGRRRATQ